MGARDPEITLRLPCPPSINSYHRHTYAPKKKRVIRYIDKKGREFEAAAKAMISEQGSPSVGDALVAVLIDVHLPTERGDHHNREKPILDVLEAAGVYDDDKQVYDLRVRRRPAVNGGRCHVTIWRL